MAIKTVREIIMEVLTEHGKPMQQKDLIPLVLKETDCTLETIRVAISKMATGGYLKAIKVKDIPTFYAKPMWIDSLGNLREDIKFDPYDKTNV